MNWQIDFSKESIKFLGKSDLDESFIASILKKAINRLSGKANENVDLKKLKGDWLGFYRIRHGETRIIFEISFENKTIWIEKIDFRGNVY